MVINRKKKNNKKKKKKRADGQPDTRGHVDDQPASPKNGQNLG
jgi:hypothetical protein